MFSIAWKNMRAERARFAFSVAGVAVAAMLIAFILALYSGWNEKIASYVQDVPVDVWVTQDGSESFFSFSVIPEDKVAQVRSTPGVTAVSSLLGRSLKLTHNGRKFDSYVYGFDQDGAGGPLHIKKGSGKPGPGEIVVDDVLARSQDLGIGDEVTVSGEPFRISGISTGGNLVINQLSFIRKEEAPDVVGVRGIVNFLLVTTDKGKATQTAAAINDGVDGVTAFKSATFAANSRKVVQKSILPILFVVLVLVFIVGAVVVGLTIYTATLEKEREFGVMKALGTPEKFLMLAVAEQSMLCGLIGFAVGELAVVVASRFAERMVPQFVTLLRWQDALIVLVAVTAMSLLAAYLPIQKVLSVDPLRVFKA